MFKRYLLLAAASTAMSFAQYTGTFFNLEPSALVMVMEQYDRKVCGTGLSRDSVDFSKATYTLKEVKSPDEEMTVLKLFNFDRMNVYGDDYVYVDAQSCFTGTVLAGAEKVIEDGLSFSEACYTWANETINGVDVVCGTAPVNKKVLLLTKPLAEQEALVREYCPGAIDLSGNIDETKALECVKLLDFREILGKTLSNPNNINF